MSSTYKVGLVGCGFMGRMHSAVYSTLTNADLVAACDLDAEKAKMCAGPARVVTDLDDLLSDRDIDAIDITLPTYLHASTAIKALEAGKHVVCEKPMALNLVDADRMMAAAKANGRTLMIAHCIRFWPEYVELQRILKSGRVGKLLSLNLTRYGAFPHWSWEGWLGKEDLSGGGALDMHVHDTDYALALLGKPNSMTSAGSVDERGVSHIFTTMHYDHAVVHLEGGWNLPSNAPFKMAFRAVFEKGLVIFDGGPLTIFEEGKDPFVPDLPKMSADGVGGNISDLGGYYFELEYFYDCLAKGVVPERATPESSRDSLAVTLAEIEEAKGGSK